MVATARGPVEVSLAGHDDGSLSVVAWLLPAGRRVGYLRVERRRETVGAAMLAPEMRDSGLAEVMRALLLTALGQRHRVEPIGQQLVRAGLLRPEDVRDLLGWQWLLDELGEHHRLGDLAQAAGLMSDPARVDERPAHRAAERPPLVPPPFPLDGLADGAVLH